MPEESSGLLQQLLGTVQQLLAQGGQIIGRLDAMAQTQEGFRSDLSSVRHEHNNTRVMVTGLAEQVSGIKGDVVDLQKQAQESATARAAYFAERGVWRRFEALWIGIAIAVVSVGGSALVTHFWPGAAGAH